MCEKNVSLKMNITIDECTSSIVSNEPESMEPSHACHLYISFNWIFV